MSGESLTGRQWLMTQDIVLVSLHRPKTGTILFLEPARFDIASAGAERGQNAVQGFLATLLASLLAGAATLEIGARWLEPNNKDNPRYLSISRGFDDLPPLLRDSTPTRP
jgi:hypothetical protein